MSFEDAPILLDEKGCIVKNDTRLFPANVPFSKNVTKKEFYISIHGMRDDFREKDEEISEYEKNPSPHNWRVDCNSIEKMCEENNIKFKQECRHKILAMLFYFEKSCREEFRKENIVEIEAFENDWNQRMVALKREKSQFEEALDRRMSREYKDKLDVFEKLLQERED